MHDEFPSPADRQNDIWVTVRNEVAWLDESRKNNQVPCWGCGAATLLAPALRNCYQFCCIKWRKTLWKNHWAEKSQLCIEFWTSSAGNLGQKILLPVFWPTSLQFLAVSHNVYRISINTPGPNQSQLVVVPVLGVSLADAYSSGDRISKASRDKGHSYCSLQSPCCHKAGIVIPFICFHSPDKTHACSSSLQMCACPTACPALGWPGTYQR